MKRFDPEEVTRGRRHELEHVDDESFAQIIAGDHLAEDPQYYTHLEACMPQTRGTCPTCKRNPGRRPRAKCDFCHVADATVFADGAFLCDRCYDAYNEEMTKRLGEDSEVDMVFTKPRRNPRLVRDATIAEKREYLHQNIDELLYPRSVRRQADVAALRRVAEDTDDLSALDDLLSDPSLADDFEWLVPGLMDSLHNQVSKASRSQIDMYTGPFFRVRRGR